MTQEVEGRPYMGVAHVGLVHRDLASARLKASMRFPPLRGMYQRGGTCKRCDNGGAIALTNWNA